MISDISDNGPSGKTGKLQLYHILAFTFTGTTITTHLLIRQSGNRWIAITGVCVLAVSAVLMFSPFYYLKKFGSVPEGHPYYKTDRLVDRGPYRLVRHPQYLGYSLLAAGFALISQNYIVILSALLAFVMFYILARIEDADCLVNFGAPYRHYAQRVPAFNILTGIIRLLFK